MSLHIVSCHQREPGYNKVTHEADEKESKSQWRELLERCNEVVETTGHRKRWHDT